MDPLKPNPLRNILLRLLTFGLLVLAARFAYVITLAADSCRHVNDLCFFPDPNAVVSTPPTLSVADIWTTKKWRTAVDYYSAIFQELIADGFLSRNSKALCVETPTGDDVMALIESGVVQAVGITKNDAFPPLIVSGAGDRQPFDEATFDFVFSSNGSLDSSTRPVDFANEVCRTLKPGGFFVAHILAKDSYSFNSFLHLFTCCRLVRSREVDGVETTLVREVVMKKETQFLSHGGNPRNKCSVPVYKRELVRKAEALIEPEPLKPWIALKKNMKKVKFLTSMADISFKQRYIYIDVGARGLGWFKKHYPKQDKSFEVYAIQGDKGFHGEYYKTQKGVSLLPYAAWVRNETLFFEIARDPGQKMGRVQNVRSSWREEMGGIRGFDFAEWLKKAVSGSDFVVVKMDVEGDEFHLLPWLIKSGAICLIDEIFLECHYNRLQRCCHGPRGPKFRRSYDQCLDLFSSLRESGVLVHQWWTGGEL